LNPTRPRPAPGGRRRPVAATLAALGLLCGAGTAAARGIEYIYIDANVGSASGGHAALRFEDEVYHFQHHEPGLLRLERDRTRDFRHRYGVLENRTLEVSRIEVDDSTWRLLRDHFARVYRVQERQIALGRALAADVALLERLRDPAPPGASDRAEADPGSPVAAAGYFFPAEGDAPGRIALRPRSPVLDRLGARASVLGGADELADRVRAVEEELAALAPWPADSAAFRLEPATLPVSRAPLSLRYAELVSARTALEVLRDAPPLRGESILDASAPIFALTPDEVARVVARADRLENDLLRLVRSGRPDWGRAMLVGMARLEALRRSAAEGRLRLLDVTPEGAGRVTAEVFGRRPEAAAGIASELRASLARARSAFLESEGPVDLPLARLEAAAARSVEVEAGLAGDRDVRFFPGTPAPARAAPRPDPGLPGWSPADSEARGADLAAARARVRDFERQLESLYAYDLFSANCVSQIFAEFEAAFAEAEEPGTPAATLARERIRAESERRLGGFVEIAGTLNFIPFVSARAVREAYRVAETRTELSYRRSQVEAMLAREPGWRVALRESNTLTSSIYSGHPDDSLFLFFTDDRFWLRPLMGIANLAVGIGETLAGVAWLPVDGGDTLLSGLDGALFSLPELAFFNIRKGRLEVIPSTPEPDSVAAGVGAEAAVAAEGPLHAGDGGEHVGTLGKHRDARVRTEPREGALDSDPG